MSTDNVNNKVRFCSEFYLEKIAIVLVCIKHHIAISHLPESFRHRPVTHQCTQGELVTSQASSLNEDRRKNPPVINCNILKIHENTTLIWYKYIYICNIKLKYYSANMFRYTIICTNYSLQLHKASRMHAHHRCTKKCTHAHTYNTRI